MSCIFVFYSVGFFFVSCIPLINSALIKKEFSKRGYHERLEKFSKNSTKRLKYESKRIQGVVLIFE